MIHKKIQILLPIIILLGACIVSCEQRTFKNRNDAVPALSLEIRLVDTFLEYPESDQMAERYELHGEVLFDNSDIKCTEVREVMGYLGEKEHVVILTLHEEGTERFADLTENNVGRKFAIIVNGEVISLPLILEPVKDGQFEIQEGYSGLTEAIAMAKGLVGQ